MCAPRIGKSIGTRGSRMSFDTCESRILMHSVPFPRLGILGAEALLISYLIVNLLFRWKLINSVWQFQLWQFLFLMLQLPPLIYITIYILINYILYIRGYCHSFFNCHNWNCHSSESVTHSCSPLQGFLLGEVPRQPRGNKLFTDTPNFPSKLPQNRFKPLRGILHHPDPRNALRTA